MLYWLLFGMFLLIVLSTAFFARSSRPFLAILGWGVVVFVVIAIQMPLTMGSDISPLLAWIVVLALLGEWARYRRFSTRQFGMVAVAGAVVYFVALLPGVFYRMHKLHQLREQFPVEDLASRLKGSRPLRSSSHDNSYLLSLESALRTEEAQDGYLRESLKELHTEELHRFVNSPGFGVKRLRAIHIHMERMARSSKETTPPIEQPALMLESPTGLPTTGYAPKRTETVALHDLHRQGVVRFAHAEGFGLQTDDLQTIGFQPHGFRKAWPLSGVCSVELVSLVLHDPPVVYVSAYLPRMDKLHDALTRPLNALESAGLEALQAGEDLFVAQTPQRLYMIGAVRNVEQCIKCHGGERGDLLGAFSYVLNR